ncbi:MAG: hypothetical protein RQM92_11420 [Candidatus Syntrophopropionicum ammoniitolerans]
MGNNIRRASCDYAWNIQQLPDGNLIMAGGTESYGAGLYDVYLIKMDPEGNVLWEKTYGGAASDCGYSLLQLADGGFLIAGNAESYGNGNPDVYLLRTDVAGEQLWEKTYGGSGSDYGWLCWKPLMVAMLSPGKKRSPGNKAYLAPYLLRVDAEGQLLGENTYGDGHAGFPFMVVAGWRTTMFSPVKSNRPRAMIYM